MPCVYVVLLCLASCVFVVCRLLICVLLICRLHVVLVYLAYMSFAYLCAQVHIDMQRGVRVEGLTEIGVENTGNPNPKP
jgi:hypothetical protein